MDTTQSLMDALKKKLNLRSDYALAKYLGVTGVTMMRWREGKSLNDENAIRVAKLLDMPPAYVLACMGALRTDEGTEASGIWRQIADAFHHTVALWVVASLLGFSVFSSDSAHADGFFDVRNNVYYVKRKRVGR